MILITLKPWSQVEGLTHIKTIWRVSDKADMSNILESVESTDMLETYFSNIFIPVGGTYYVEATRVFNNGTRTTLDPIPTINYGNKESSMLLQDDIIIEEPFVYVNKEDIFSNDTYIPIKTSQFRCNGDDHAYTHYIVLDDANNLMFCKLYDKVNKTSINIPNNYDYKNKSKLHFIAIHGSSTNVESPVGKTTIRLTSDYNFEINSETSWIEPLRDFNIVFTPIDPTKAMNIFKVELLAYDSEDLILTLDRNDNTFLIPWYYLKESIKYKIAIYAYDLDLRYSKIIKEIKVATFSNTIIKDPSFIYYHRVDEQTITSADFLPHVGFHTEALFNNNILIPTTDKTFQVWHAVDKNLTKTSAKANGIKLLSSNIENSLIKPLTKGLVLLDVLNESGKPTFMLYSYSNHNDTFNLEKSLSRDDETICVGKTNAFIQISTYEFIYNPIGTNKLRLYNIDTNKIENLDDIPMDKLTKAILIRMDNNNILIANGEDYNTKMYNYGNRNYLDGLIFGPSTFIGADLRTIQLLNGDTLITKVESVGETKEPSCIVFKYKENDFEYGELQYNGVFPNISILANTGYIHLGRFVPGDTAQQTRDTTDLKVYY